jgi:hypothetical protein
LRVRQFARGSRRKPAAAERAIHLLGRFARLRFVHAPAFEFGHQIGQHAGMGVPRFARLKDQALARHVEIFDAQSRRLARRREYSRRRNGGTRQKRASGLLHNANYSAKPMVFPARHAMSIG